MINDDDFKIFPVRFGGSVGKALENKMLDVVGGPASIRTRIIGNTMLRTRGGFPEFTTLKEPVIIESASRTFVFRNIGATTGVVANRNGGDMKVAVSNLSVSNFNHSVMSSKNDTKGKWFDVLRWDADNATLNGKEESYIPQLPDVSNYGNSALPALIQLASPLPGSATASPVVVATSDGVRRVTLLDVAGNEHSSKSVTGYTYYTNSSSCGVSFNASEMSFTFIGATWFLVNGVVDRIYTKCSTIAISDTHPYLEETATVSNYYLNESAPTSWPTPRWPSNDRIRCAIVSETSTFVDAYNESATFVFVPYPVINTPYMYIGSPAQVNIDATLSGEYLRVKSGHNWSNGIAHVEQDVSADSTSTFIATAFGFEVISYAITYNVVSNYFTHWTASPQTTTYGSSSTVTSMCNFTTRDFVYLDSTNGVSIRFESVFDASYSKEMLDGEHVGTTMISSLVSAYILKYEGQETRFEVSSLSGSQIFDEADIGFIAHGPTYCRDTITVESAQLLLNAPYRHPVIIAPKFMDQGNCPYFAYTTSSEESAGASSECYLDIELAAEPWIGSVADHDIYGGVVHFIPFNFIALANRMLGKASIASEIQSYPDFWAAVFPTPTFRIQFANGTSGPWQGQLGAGFSNGTPVEISRI